MLGVCLGMQLLADGSEEGSEPGLGLIAGQVRRLPVEVDGVRHPVPHMGWNTVEVDTTIDLLASWREEGRRYYFVHSYAFACDGRGGRRGRRPATAHPSPPRSSGTTSRVCSSTRRRAIDTAMALLASLGRHLTCSSNPA